ncbi:ABC transporter substrate-binding protein [Actinomadura sp. SCN-SB]|uniref:ABC transporter substrate-binding protein n=1 Tax=Actinomadura sp. SCN-SB TaxID=3373092 RepID=UPI003753732E
MRARPALTSLIGACAVLVAACGGSGGGSEKGIDEPIKMVGLWEVKGESAAAIDDYNNGARMAVEKINAAGGIKGQKIVLERVAADPLNPQKATGQFLQAVDKDPVVMLGFTASSALLASKTQVDRAGIPLISLASASSPLRFGGPGGSEWFWVVQPSDEFKDQATVRFAVEQLKATKIGLMGTNESYGMTNTKAVAAALKQRGLTPVATRNYDPTATDLTQDVLAMKGSQAVIAFTYPNPLAVQLKQFVQNGMKIPTISSSSANIAANNKLVTGEALSLLYGTNACAPVGSKNPATNAFGQEYLRRFNQIPTDLAAESHDAVYIAKAAIEKAGSTDPEAIRKAMNSITVTPQQGIICAAEYKTDGAHFMNHTVSIQRFGTDGKSTEMITYQFPPTEAAKG